MSVWHDIAEELGLEFKTYNELVNYTHAVPLGFDMYYVFCNGICIAKLGDWAMLEKYLLDAEEANLTYKKIMARKN